MLFLPDTGVRNTELCNLRLSDLDKHLRWCTILGKGNRFSLILMDTLSRQAGN